MERQTYTQASKDPRWIEAMQGSASLESNNTWELTTLPLVKRPLAANGYLESSVKQMVILNNSRPDLLQKDLPNKKERIIRKLLLLAKMVSVRALLATDVHHNWYIEQLDINNRFLHGDLSEEVYMIVPQGYHQNLPSHSVCRLKKSLHGLKHTNRQWFTKLTTFLLTLGFKQSYVDTLLLTYHEGNTSLGIVI